MIGSGAGGLAACARRVTATAAAELTIKSRRDRVRGAFIGNQSGKRSRRWEADCVRTLISAAALAVLSPELLEGFADRKLNLAQRCASSGPLARLRVWRVLL